MSHIAIVNCSSPYGSTAGLESLDLALAAGNFAQQVSLFFIDDGVFQLLKHQEPERVGFKNYSKTFKALEFYDIEDIFVCDQSLIRRNLEQKDLAVEVQVLQTDELNARLLRSQHILRF